MMIPLTMNKILKIRMMILKRLELLNPNHLLTMIFSVPSPPPGKCVAEDLYTGKKVVQSIIFDRTILEQMEERLSCKHRPQTTLAHSKTRCEDW